MDRNKVITELKDIAWRERNYLADVTGEESGAIAEVLYIAAEMLKEQEPVKPVKTWDTYLCGNCNRNVYHEERQGCLVLYEERYTYCPNCGKRLDWNAGQG